MLFRTFTLFGGVALATALLGTPHAAADPICVRVDANRPLSSDTGFTCAPYVSETLCIDQEAKWGSNLDVLVTVCPPAPLG